MRLVDDVMPRLKDTELRILLIVLRQTSGWKSDRAKTSSKWRTKQRDWLSHSQLCRRTGRGSDAVSRAVSALTAYGLIIVEDAGGKPLLTPKSEDVVWGASTIGRERSGTRKTHRLKAHRKAPVEKWITHAPSLPVKA